MKQMVVRLQLKHELFHWVHHWTIYSFTRSTIFTALFATETWKISLGPRSYLVLHISWVPTKTFALKTIVKLVKALYSHYKDRDQKKSLIPEMLCGPGLYFGEQQVWYFREPEINPMQWVAEKKIEKLVQNLSVLNPIYCLWLEIQSHPLSNLLI